VLLSLNGITSPDDFCQWCGRFVHEGESLHRDEMGLTYCGECFESLKEIENGIQTTKTGRDRSPYIKNQ